MLSKKVGTGTVRSHDLSGYLLGNSRPVNDERNVDILLKSALLPTLEVVLSDVVAIIS
jgi:hypothetical protein